MGEERITTSSGNRLLTSAKTAKQDEFYTQLPDIANELKHYKKHFEGKIVLCNCDDPFESNFFKYFAANFNTLGLKKLITTSYAGSPIVGGQLPLIDIEGLRPFGNKEPYLAEINEVPDRNNDGAIGLDDVRHLLEHDANTCRPLTQGGDFRSHECVEILKAADIIVTNPPFSLFREYIALLIEHEKDFLIIGTLNACHYQEIFRLFKDNRIWMGPSIHSGDREFRVPDHYPLHAAGYRVDQDGVKYIRVKGVRWFTNLDHAKRHEQIPLFKTFAPEEYPKYDNLEAIEVAKAADIPVDYYGLMGVPDSFLDRFNPEQFELVGIPFGNMGKEIGVGRNYRGRTDIALTKDGRSRCPYSRIIIKRKVASAGNHRQGNTE